MRYKTRNLDKQHKGKVYALAQMFSNCIFQFYKTKDLKDEDELVSLTNIRRVNRPTSLKVQRTAASLSFSMGLSSTHDAIPIFNPAY